MLRMVRSEQWRNCYASNGGRDVLSTYGTRVRSAVLAPSCTVRAQRPKPRSDPKDVATNEHVQDLADRVVAVMALAASACGGDDTEAPSGTDAPQDVPETVVPTSSGPIEQTEGSDAAPSEAASAEDAAAAEQDPTSGLVFTPDTVPEGSDAAQPDAASSEAASAEDAAAAEQDPTSGLVFTPDTVPEGYTGAKVEYVTVEMPDWSPPQAQQVPALHPDTRRRPGSQGRHLWTPASLIAVSVLPADHIDADPQYPGGETPRPTPALEQFAEDCLRAASGF